jgi:hypothetical protein
MRISGPETAEATEDWNSGIMGSFTSYKHGQTLWYYNNRGWCLRNTQACDKKFENEESKTLMEETAWKTYGRWKGSIKTIPKKLVQVFRPISTGWRQRLVATSCEHAMDIRLPQHALCFPHSWSLINLPRRVAADCYVSVNTYFHQEWFCTFRVTLLSSTHRTKSCLHLDLNSNWNFAMSERNQ